MVDSSKTSFSQFLSDSPIQPSVGEVADAAIDRLTHWVPDFPEPGVIFADLSPVLADARAFGAVVESLGIGFGPVDLVAGLDARGFLVGAAVALSLNVGVIPLRKGGRLPTPLLTQSYDLEYGHAELELPQVGFDLSGKRVLIVDDVLATGGTVAAARSLLTRADANVIGASVVMEIDGLNGRTQTPDLQIRALKGSASCSFFADRR